jgi:hypothetical protein
MICIQEDMTDVAEIIQKDGYDTLCFDIFIAKIIWSVNL